MKILVNPFLANVPILCPLKTPKNTPENIKHLRFFGVFMGYKMETLARNGSNRMRANAPLFFRSFQYSTANPTGY